MENPLTTGLSRLRNKVGPTGTFVILAILLVPMVCWFHDMVLRVVSGRLFAEQLGSLWGVECATNQGFLCFTVFTAVALPYIAAVRWISDRSTRLGYWVFAVPTVAVCVCLLSLLTAPFYWSLLYIPTAYQPLYFVYGIGGYVVVLAFLRWAIWPPNRRRDQPGWSLPFLSY